MIDLGALKISIVTGANDAIKELNSVGDTADKQESKFKKFGKGVAVGMAVGVTAIASATTGMIAMATKTAETTDRIDKMSGKMGLSNQAFQEWDYVMGQSGMSIDTMKTGMKTLVTQMGMADEGSAKSVEAFDKLGVSWEDGTDKLKSQEEMMQEAIFALADMDDKTEQAKLATELFGKAGVEMIPMLEGGSQGIKDLTDRSHELGLILNDETIGAGVLLGDTMDDVKGMFGAVVTEIGGQFMPILQKVLEWVLAHMPEIKEVIKVAFDVVKKVVDIAWKALDAILPILTTLYNWVKPYFPVIGQMIGDTFDGIIGFASGLVDAIGYVIDKIKDVIDWFKKLSIWDNYKAPNINYNTKQSKGNFQLDGTHANGLSYVPFDGYVAELHKGERVLTAEENSSGNSEVVKAIKRLEATLINKNMNVSIGKETIGKTALEYSKGMNRMTGEFAY